VDSGAGRVRAGAALAATLIVTLSVFITTRLRIGFVQKFSRPGQPYPPATLGYWAIGPAVVVVFAMLALLVGRTGATWPEALSAQPGSSGELHTLRTVVFVGVPLVAIIGISLLLRKIWTKHPERNRKARPPKFDDQDVAAVTIVGTLPPQLSWWWPVSVCSVLLPRCSSCAGSWSRWTSSGSGFASEQGSSSSVCLG
jgi:hypothetical protein